MALKHSIFFVGAAAILTVAGCGTSPLKHGQYWQRVSVSEAAYQRGPKAQQILNRDIARCVTELRELERLGVIKNAIPTDLSGRVLDPDQAQMEDWDTPERDKHLFAEHADYHDFEGCMLSKGWERIKYVPYDVQERARDDYLKSQIDYEYQTKAGKRHSETSMSPAPGYGGDFKNVNE